MGPEDRKRLLVQPVELTDAPDFGVQFVAVTPDMATCVIPHA